MSHPVIESPGIHSTFTHLCKWCGDTVHVTDSRTEPHTCRIELRTA